MSTPVRTGVSPQSRGRELAREGRQLWLHSNSVRQAAAELVGRYRDVPSMQAYRYAAGLSQDQAAARYNEMTGHHTSLGGTTINAWETWARGRGAGSPPTFSSLLVLAEAYGRGPLGTSEEEISPADLVAESYERLSPEDQLALRKFANPTAPAEVVANAPNEVGPDFNLPVPSVPGGSPTVRAFSLPASEPGQLLNAGWQTFGFGIERLIRQIKNLGRRLDVDICFGVNEAGLVMATFLASAHFGRCAIGYLKSQKLRDDITLDECSFYPPAKCSPTIVICDFEVKQADVVGFIAREIRDRYPDAELYFAVFGAMTKASDLEVGAFEDLTGERIMKAADFAAVFVAATMSPPGIEPPLELR